MSTDFRQIDQCVTAPLGFRAGVIAAGIKSDATLPDLALLVADVPCVAAGTFTPSSTAAPSVVICKTRLSRPGTTGAQALIVNSGNANCATGEQGERNAYRMTSSVARQLGIDEDLVLCSSTGIIGRQLPIEKIEAAVEQIKLVRENGNAFAEAIMTTDTRPKRIALEFEIDGKRVRLGGVAKGSGMIYPNMATLLSYITTDAVVDREWLQRELQSAVAESFNRVAVDGDMSTNDSCILFASGLAGNTMITDNHPEVTTFRTALREVTQHLAIEIARDGEGATKLMTVHVRGARTKKDAVKAARGITLSPIWKCAVAGEDPNWGRIVAALGASGSEVLQDRYDISIGNVLVARQGIAAEYEETNARAAMQGKEVTITIDLHLGEEEATAWGCDLTHGYVDENTFYTR